MFLDVKNSESGRSMIEILGVMALMALLTASAFILISSGMATQKRSEITDKVSDIVTGVRSLYAEYDNLPSSFDGDKTLSALSIDANGPDGTTFAVSRSSDKQFIVTVTGLSEDECGVLAAKAWTGSVNGATCESTTLTTLTITYKK